MYALRVYYIRYVEQGEYLVKKINTLYEYKKLITLSSLNSNNVETCREVRTISDYDTLSTTFPTTRIIYSSMFKYFRKILFSISFFSIDIISIGISIEISESSSLSCNISEVYKFLYYHVTCIFFPT